MEELSDTSVDRVFARLGILEKELNQLTAQSITQPSSTWFKLGKKEVKKSDLLKVFQAIGAGLLFVMFF